MTLSQPKGIMRVHDSADALQQCGCKVTKCGLELPPSLSLETWEVVGRVLGEMDDKLRWWIGDWWAYGEHRYGDRRALVESTDWHGPKFQTCVNYANVCRKFESNRRRLVLSFTHHVEVAHLKPAEADHLLDWCEETRAATGKPRATDDLRDEVRRRRIEQMSPSSFGFIEPAKVVALTIAPAPPTEEQRLVLLPVAAPPRHEPEVREQLAEATPRESSAVREARELALAGIYAALRREAITVELREQLQQCLRILGPS